MTRAEVIVFCDMMERVLRQNDHKGDSWKLKSTEALFERLREEVDELEEALRTQSDAAVKEAIDVANFAMFIAFNAGVEQIARGLESYRREAVEDTGEASGG